MAQLNLLEPNEDATLPQGNRKLVAYGIQNEGSDYRVHVGFKAQRVIVFPTRCGRTALERVKENRDYSKAVYSPDEVAGGWINTAEGYAVPISYIEHLSEIGIPQDIYNAYRVHKGMTTSEKGQRAAAVVYEMLRRDLIPLPVMVNHADSQALQVSGTDFLINASLRLQVKCDYRAGSMSHGGTGNVFIQIAECNPYRRY